MTKSGEVVLEGEVDRITFESQDGAFRVVRVVPRDKRPPVVVVGSFPPVAVGSRIRARGTMVEDPRHGPQLKAEAVTELAPSTLAGIERYLGSGLIKGIGEAYAKRIVAAFGLETLRVLDEEPHRLRGVEGLGKKRIDAIASAWAEQRGLREVMVFLQAHGVSATLAARIYKRYGKRALAIVSSDPYRLALDLWGVGFRTADRLAESLGVGRDSPQRIQAGILQTLHDARESGHVFLRREEAYGHAARLLGFEEASAEPVEPALDAAVLALVSGDHVVVEGAGADAKLYEAEMYKAEGRVAERVASLVGRPLPELPGAQDAIRAFQKETGVELAPEQAHAIELVSRSALAVVTGGPGVGKTTIVRAMIRVLEAAGLTVKLAAPTGRAAKRMTEATGKEALTLHRLLEFEPKKGKFRRGRDLPVDGGAVIVDEASMVDLPLADALLAAVGETTRLVLVGDVDQLPSVGPGAILRDLIASKKVPCARLSFIFRQAQSSLIVVNAHRIHAGEAPVMPAKGDDRADFFVVERKDGEHARATVVELVKERIPRRFGLDPVQDVQVLAPMHRGPAGTTALNEALQAALNPVGPALVRGTRTFRMGDKVMQLRNDYDRNVWNGDVGFVTRIDGEEGTLDVGFDPRRKNGASSGEYERVVTYDASSLDDLTLAYACSVHKSQGSEYPAVVIPLLTTHFVMLSRNLLYTAVTRGKKLVVLVADPRALSLALNQAESYERRTDLSARIAAALQAG